MRNALAGILGGLTMFIGLLSIPAASAQPILHNLEEGQYSVGFRVFDDRDETRTLPTSSNPPRPVRIYLWYPARVSDAAEAMRFGRYAALAEGDVWPDEFLGGLRDKLSYSNHVLARSLGPGGLERLAEQRLRAYENIEPRPGPFPLIVMGQGLNYESPIALASLAEYLAGRGFVVATCPLVGTHSPFVRLDVQDLESQVRDLEFVVAHARALPYVSPEKLGVVGFDMGGMVGLILAMRNPSVDAFASLQAGILVPHPSGLPMASPDHDPLRLSVPWLHVSARGGTPQAAPTTLMDTAVHSERHHLRIDGLQHVDSTSYALIEGRRRALGFWSAWESRGVERHQTLARYTAEFFHAVLEDSRDSQSFLSRDPTLGEGAGLTMEHRAAIPPPIGHAELVKTIVSGDTARAVEQIRKLWDTQPASQLASDTYLYRLAYTLLYRWGLGNEAMQLSELNVQLHPHSLVATRALSMSYMAGEDFEGAIEVYQRYLEKDPDNETARRTLQWLRGQRER